MPVVISVESPLQDDVRVLVAELNDHLKPLTPPEFQFQLTVDEMAALNTTVFVARDKAGQALGCGALTVHDDGFGEVKRMFTVPAVRGARVGTRLLDAIVAAARELGVDRLLLETGVGPGFAAAWRLYERNGFTRRGPFLDYPDSNLSAFYERRLESSDRRAYG